MLKSQRIAELERERAEQWTALELMWARLRGIDAELDWLRAGIVPVGELAESALTEAILVVVRTAGRTVSPTDIQQCLADAGRAEALNKITATLGHLLHQHQVVREGRGKYRSA